MQTSLKLAALATTLILAACGGGGGDDDASDPDAGGGGGGGSTPLTCHTANYVAGAVGVPGAADLAAYAGTYDGEEGSFDADFRFVKSGDASFVLGADGAATYKGTPLAIASYCMDNAPGPYGRLLYVEFAGGHFDISTTDAGEGLRWAWGVDPSGGMFRNGVKR